MDFRHLKYAWLSEESLTFKGWDFSYIANRTSEEELPWDYRTIVKSHMGSTKTMLDMGTGGGEFLLSLAPPKNKTFATEAHPPNYEWCRNTLPNHGIDVRQVFRDEELPFDSCFFDLIINRHESFSSREVFRILKPGGLYITQQVGGQNNRELSRFLLDTDSKIVDAEFNLKTTKDDLMKAGFTISDEKESFPLLRFYDVGALVYFAKIIEWEFPGFSVERCFHKLCLLQEKVDKEGFIESREHRFLIVATK